MTSQTLEQPFLHRALRSVTALRKSIRNYFFTLCGLTLLIFLLSPGLLQGVQQHLGGKLYFFSVAGPFLAHAKLALFGAFFLLVPWCMMLLWKGLGSLFGVPPSQLRSFILFTCLLFYGGTVFCYLVTLPFGIQFLLGFGSEELKPVISVGRCINFVTVFLLAFGLVFELPVFMIFLAQVKVCSLAFYKKNRRYAVLGIAIMAAVLTPTPDVVNMALMGGPLYLLYEAGIFIVSFLDKRRLSG